jgi:hypothetical protein
LVNCVTNEVTMATRNNLALETVSLSNIDVNFPLWRLKFPCILHWKNFLHLTSVRVGMCVRSVTLLDGDAAVPNDDWWGWNLPQCHSMHQNCYRLPCDQGLTSADRNCFSSTFIILIQFQAARQEVLYCHCVKIFCCFCLWPY